MTITTIFQIPLFKNVTGKATPPDKRDDLVPSYTDESGVQHYKVFNNQSYEEDLSRSGYTKEQAEQYWNKVENADPYAQMTKQISATVASQAPKVSIDNNKLVISAPQQVLDSPLVAQLDKELSSLKGVDLKSPEVINAINNLNTEIQTNALNSMIEESLGWTPDEFNDYQNTVQILSGTNPIKSSNYIKWAKDGQLIVGADGKPMEKTPEEWLEYWKTNYSADERNELFQKSLRSSNPYERTMALVMSGGSATPVYGFEWWEKLGQGLGAAGNQLMKYPEGAFRQYVESEKTKDLENSARYANIPVESLKKISVTNESQFNDKIAEIKNKSENEYTDDDKAFLLMIAKANENHLFQDIANKTSLKSFTGLDIPIFGPITKVFEGGEKIVNAISQQLNSQSDEDILNSVSFEDYKRIKDDYNSWQGYGEGAKKREEALEKNANWSGSAQKIGSAVGSIGRFLWEAAVTRGLTGGIIPTGEKGVTGGFNVNSVSDMIGNKLVESMASMGISPVTPLGQSMMQFTANLIGTIPEDALQGAMDNIVTYNEQENANLLDPEQMSDSFKRNMAIMGLFNMARVGYNSVKRAKVAKALKKMEDLNKVVDIDRALIDTDDLARGIKNGDTIKTDGDKVSIVSKDGTEKVLESIKPEEAEMVQLDLFGKENMESTPTKPADYGTPEYSSRPKTYSDILYEKSLITNRLDELNAQKQDWIDNDYKDESGNDVRVREVSENGDEIPNTSKMERVSAEIDDLSSKLSVLDNTLDEIKGVKSIGETAVDNTATKTVAKTVDNAAVAVDSTPAVKVEVDTPNGRIQVETPDYRPKSIDDALKIKPESTPAGVKQWHIKSLERATKDFDTHLQTFHDKFGDVRVSDFDWVWYNTKKGLSPEKIIGTVDPTTGRAVTKNMIDAMKWWSEQPFTKTLRLASRGALGLEGDFDTLGYLPHTTYDPTNMSFDEALTGSGSLWKTSTGASVLGDNNMYKGFGGDFQSRYRTFASNMLWDAKAKSIAASKLIEEAQMEGVDLTPAQAMKATDGAVKIQESVNNASSTKEFSKAFETDGDVDFKKIAENTEKDAKNSGLGKATHDNWGEVYANQNSARIAKQRRGVVNSLDTQANFLRNTQTADGSMYENGAADIVYSRGNAADIVYRYTDPTNTADTNLREMLVDYYTNHGRPQKYAEFYADKALSRLGEIDGPLTKIKIIDSLSNSMKWEAWSRLRRWLVRADYDNFNASTKKYIDQFLFNHMQMDSIKNNPKISQRLSRALDGLTGLRYRALFYGNIKNALLQTSELNRYFSAFKWGDVAKMAKRLATDESFRARVDIYTDIIAPKTSRLDADLYGKYSDIADNMTVEENGVKFSSLGKKAKETADAIGLGPIEAAEAFKNRMMIAGLVQEADRLKLTGDEALRHIRKRFERVALAADEMGRIGMSSNPLARTMLFLQNFQMRELGMHLYNILDETDMAKSMPGKVVNATKYLTKVFGAKLATTLILARLGYSASQTMGLDPFGLLDNYNQMDDEDMEWVDKQIAGGLLTPIFSGGMTSLISDMYFMARKAYEDSTQQTVSDEAEQRLGSSWGLAMPEGIFSFENLMSGAANFVPGSTTAKRIGQMNEMMDTGWATSSTGNKMYTAPTDPVNTLLGYLFGRSATWNAQQYNQTYGDNLLQTLGRLNPLREYGEFDPIDTKNYSDWFKGDENDAQQFNKGRYYFQKERDRILDEYEAAIKDSYASADEIAEAKNNMNTKLEDLYGQLDRFVDAYEKKNGTISPSMTKQIVNILNTGRNVVGDTPEQAEERSKAEYNKALERYSQLGMSPVGTYTGPSKYNPEQEVKYQGSPQWRSAISGYYNVDDELVDVLKLADNKLSPLRDELKDKINYAYTAKNYDYLATLQKQYLNEFDQVVGPIIAAYGVDAIKKNGEVENQLKKMLNSGGLIPSNDYAKNKYGKYQSMPYQEVDVGAWAQKRYGSDTYKNPTIRSYSTADEDISEIKKLISEGKTGRAMARALELKVRVNNQSRSLSKDDLKWLNNFVNGGNK